MAEKITVWTYWHAEERPAMIDDCIASWRQHLDSEKFQIVIVSEQNLSDYLSPEWIDQIPDFKELRRANQADFIRLSLLKLYGGVWMDASIFLFQDLSFIRDFGKFYAPRIPILDTRTVQVFFLVAPKNDYIISKWLDLYTSVLKTNGQLKFKWYQKSFYTSNAFFRTYFKIYSAYAYLHRTDSDFRKNTPKFGEYNEKMRVDMRNVIKFLKVLSFTKLKMHKRAIEARRQEQLPTLALSKNNELVFYKMNEFDRQVMKDMRALG